MKSALLVVTLIVGCQSSSKTASSGSAGSGSELTGSAAGGLVDPLDVCATGQRALIGLETCGGKPMGKELLTAKQTFAGVADAVKQTNPGAAETTCAQMLHALDGELTTLGCPLSLSKAERGRMLDLVEAWYAVRTPVTPSGNAAADAVVARVVKVRDAACACKTEECLAKVQEQFDTLGKFADDAPTAAQELGAKLLDDVGRCGARIRKPVRR